MFGDERGYFFESYNERALGEIGITERFVQDNHSPSCRNVLRGLHDQIKQPQGKLVLVADGEILDVAVDVRRSSPTFGHGRRRGCQRVMAYSGLNETGATNTAVEFYTIVSGWSPQYPASWTPDLYPRLHLLPNGKVFYFAVPNSILLQNENPLAPVTSISLYSPPSPTSV